jgi:hypothetical protein
MSPGLRLIYTDLVFVHKIVHGNSVIKYEDNFKVKQQVSPKVMGEQTIFRGNQIVIPKYRLQIARYRFSFRTRRYWNIVPDELKNLKLANFKVKLKKYILLNKQKFLNLSRSYNIVGEVVEKRVKKKKGCQKFRTWQKDKRLSDAPAEKVRGCLHPAVNKKILIKKKPSCKLSTQV